MCSATRSSLQPKLDAAEREFDGHLLWHHAELEAASVRRCGIRVDEAAVWGPVPWHQLWPVGSGGCLLSYSLICKITTPVKLNYSIMQKLLCASVQSNFLLLSKETSVFLTGEDCDVVALLLVVEHYFLHHRSTLCKAPIAPFMAFKLTPTMRFGSGAKCLVGKSLESLATLCSSTSHPKVNTNISISSYFFWRLVHNA